ILVIGLVVSGIIGAAVLSSRARDRIRARFDEILRAAAKELGASFVEGSDGGRVSGEIDGVRLSIDGKIIGQRNGPQVLVWIRGGVPRPLDALTLRQTGLGSTLIGRDRVQTGDEKFDEQIFVACKSRAQALAWLGEDVRRAAELVIGHSGKMTDGRIELEC